MNWVLEKLSGLFAPKYIGSLVRGALQALAGVLIGLGLAEPDVSDFVKAAEPVLTGLALLAVSLGWSFVQKYKHSD